MRLKVVSAYTQYLGIQALKLFQILLKGLHLACSGRGEIGKVEGQDHMALSPVIFEPDLAFR
jgi:hypothetical protein